MAVDASEEFLADLAGVTDPEAKRKRIGARFMRVFEAAEARRCGRRRRATAHVSWPRARSTRT